MPVELPDAVQKLVTALTTQQADLPPGVRRAMVDRARALSLGDDSGATVPESFVAYVDKVTRWAYKVLDADVDALRAVGWSDDAIFEATLCAATGAGLARFERGLALLDEAAGRRAG